MPSPADVPIISRFKASCTQLPIRSSWPPRCASSWGSCALYLADLDAIAGDAPDLALYQKLISERLLLDR